MFEIIDEIYKKENVNVVYPQIRGLKNEEAEEKINQTIKTRVSNTMYQIGLGDENLATLEGTYKVTFNKGNILSFRFEYFTYFEMAAHPMTYVKSLTFNLKTGNLLSLSDFFRKNSDYRIRINRRIKKEIKEKDIPLIDQFKGIGDDHEYYLTEDGFVIYYQLYELAPYVYGIPEFLIPYRDLESLLLKVFREILC